MRCTDLYHTDTDPPMTYGTATKRYFFIEKNHMGTSQLLWFFLHLAPVQSAARVFNAMAWSVVTDPE